MHQATVLATPTNVMQMVLPAVLVVLAFVAGLFVDQRHKFAAIPLPPPWQIVGAAVIMGAIGGLVTYFSDDVRSVPVLVGTAVLWGLVAPAVYLGNMLRDRVSPWDPQVVEDDAAQDSDRHISEERPHRGRRPAIASGGLPPACRPPERHQNVMCVGYGSSKAGVSLDGGS